MKTHYIFPMIILISTNCLSQSEKKIDDPTLFDFWVGEWNLTWKNQDGTSGSGKNHIIKILNGKVIQENFEDSNGYKGMSLSVFSSKRKTWHQAWADSQEGYYNFEGGLEGNMPVFKTIMREVDGKKIIQRMKFYDITKDSLVWEWEITKDGGITWESQWRIYYTRKK